MTQIIQKRKSAKVQKFTHSTSFFKGCFLKEFTFIQPSKRSLIFFFFCILFLHSFLFFSSFLGDFAFFHEKKNLKLNHTQLRMLGKMSILDQLQEESHELTTLGLLHQSLRRGWGEEQIIKSQKAILVCEIVFNSLTFTITLNWWWLPMQRSRASWIGGPFGSAFVAKQTGENKGS